MLSLGLVLVLWLGLCLWFNLGLWFRLLEELFVRIIFRERLRLAVKFVKATGLVRTRVRVSFKPVFRHLLEVVLQFHLGLGICLGQEFEFFEGSGKC